MQVRTAADDPAVTVHHRRDGAGLYTRRPVGRGQVLLPLAGAVRPHPTRYSIQVGVDRHLAPAGDGDADADGACLWRFLNHGCLPTARVDVVAGAVVAARDLAPGEEVTFDYHTTEWSLASPFRCACPEARCYGTVRGFAHLPPAHQRRLLRAAAPHIRGLYRARPQAADGSPPARAQAT